MNNSFQNLNRFFEEIKIIGFWKRIWSWRQIKKLSYDAYEEYKLLLTSYNETDSELKNKTHEVELLQKDIAQTEALKKENSDFKSAIQLKDNESGKLTSDLSSANTKIQSLTQQIYTLEQRDIPILKEKTNSLNTKIQELEKENTIFKQTEESRDKEYKRNISEVNTLKEHLDSALKEIQEREINKERERNEKMKQTWARHQESVKEFIKLICQKHIIEYVDTVPFKGSPDNTIKICNEYVIFDAKSPSNDDLTNFPNYIKSQTESVRKYIKQENVKKDIFLVIPSNTIPVIKQFTFNMADYTVYIVTVDTLEPIILSLRKIEDYDFAKKLSPEERENICRVIGRFAHMTKRRIQIDQFFEKLFLDALTRAEIDLPDDIKQQVVEYEKAEILNPSQERKNKLISTAQLEKESKKIQKEAEAKDILFPDELSGIKQIPLSSDNE